MSPGILRHSPPWSTLPGETRAVYASVQTPDGAKARLATVVAALRRAAAYPGAVTHVEAIETHMSWVFLTDTHAWKLKKPVRTALLDFTTSDARRAACEGELVLNRRLAPDVYLAVVPVVRRDDTIGVGGVGETVDWLVQMRRLRLDRMLDRCIEAREVHSADVARLADTLSRFYRSAERAPVDGAAYRASFAAEIASKSASLLQPRYGLSADDVRSAVSAQQGWLAQHGTLLGARGAHVVDAHGDLRPQHICLEERQPAIIDCLEFSRPLRLLDPLSELSFLALECRRLGDAPAGEAVLRACAARLGPPAPATLCAFYMSFHALVRAAVAVWHLDDDALEHSDKWRARGSWYVRAARDLL